MFALRRAGNEATLNGIEVLEHNLTDAGNRFGRSSARRSKVFLQALWKQGALVGQKPEHGFFVRCGKGETMTTDDIAAGNVSIEIGFAPIKPAEFVIIRIRQMTART